MKKPYSISQSIGDTYAQGDDKVSKLSIPLSLRTDILNIFDLLSWEPLTFFLSYSLLWAHPLVNPFTSPLHFFAQAPWPFFGWVGESYSENFLSCVFTCSLNLLEHGTVSAFFSTVFLVKRGFLRHILLVTLSNFQSTGPCHCVTVSNIHLSMPY